MEKGLPVDDQVMDETYGVATLVVNRFVVSTNPASFRIVFGEAKDIHSRINWRLGVSLTPMEAYELKNVLEQLLVPFKENIDATLAEFYASQASRDGHE